MFFMKLILLVVEWLEGVNCICNEECSQNLILRIRFQFDQNYCKNFEVVVNINFEYLRMY